MTMRPPSLRPLRVRLSEMRSASRMNSSGAPDAGDSAILIVSLRVRAPLALLAPFARPHGDRHEREERGGADAEKQEQGHIVSHAEAPLRFPALCHVRLREGLFRLRFPRRPAGGKKVQPQGYGGSHRQMADPA